MPSGCRRAERAHQAAIVERHVLTAPFGGVVSRRMGDLGEWVGPDTPILELVQTDRLWLDVRVPQGYFGRVSRDSEVRVRLDAIAGEPLRARVAEVVPVSDPDARTFPARIALPNPEGRMTPGMSGRATLRIGTGRSGVVVPRDALIRYPDGREFPHGTDVEAGQLYSDIAVGVSASILASMLVAVTLVPTAAANLAIPARGPIGEVRRGVAAAATAAVGWLVATWLRRAVTIVAIGLASAGILWGLAPAAEYLPPGEEPKIFARMHAPPGCNLDTVAAIGHRIQDRFLPHLEDDPRSYAGGEDEVPPLAYLLVIIDASRVLIIAEPKLPEHADELMAAMRREYERNPGMRSFVTRSSIITSNQGTTRSVDLDISGPDLASVYAAATAAYRRAEEVFDDPSIQADPPTLSLSQPLVEVRPDWDRAAELGMDTADIGFTVAALTDGAFVDEFFLADDKIDVYLYGEGGPDAPLGRLAELPIHTPDGAVVPLSSIARVTETVDTSTIRRVDGRRTVTLSVIPPETIALETGVGIVREQVLGHLRDTGAIPAAVGVGISGASDQLDATREALSGNYAVALVLVYLVMVAIFTHWGYPLLIMTAIPLGVAGGFGGLWIMNEVGALRP